MRKIIDLSHSISNEMPVNPGSYKPSISWRSTINKNGRSSSIFCMSTHTGTHVDAPRHFFEDGISVDEIPLYLLSGKALFMDLSHQKSDIITLDTIEKSNLTIHSGEILIINTGTYQSYGTESFFTDYPILDIRVTKWLINKGIKALGIDTFSIDRINKDCKTMLNHSLLLSHNIPIIEGLTNLGSIYVDCFDFYAFPLKLSKRDGAPCRAIAIVEE